MAWMGDAGRRLAVFSTQALTPKKNQHCSSWGIQPQDEGRGAKGQQASREKAGACAQHCS